MLTSGKQSNNTVAYYIGYPKEYRKRQMKYSHHCVPGQKEFKQTVKKR